MDTKDILKILEKEMDANSFNRLNGALMFGKKDYTIEELARGLTHYCFRNGPVEDMHADGKLSQEDMKVLNAFCYDKIYTFFTLLISKDAINLQALLGYHSRCGSDWDKPKFEID